VPAVGFAVLGALGSAGAVRTPGDPPLAELTSALARLPGNDSMRATVDVQLSRVIREGGSPHSIQARVQLEVEDGPEGIRVAYPRHLLQRAEQERRAQTEDPEKDTPSADGLQALNVNDLAQVLDGGTALLRDLQAARFIEARPASYGGKPARLIVVALEPRLSKEARRHLKSSSSTLSIWLGDDGLPVGAERTDHIKAGFLVLNFEDVRKQTWAYAHHGNRLVAVRHSVDDTGSGLGQDFRNTTTTAVTVVR
jgi:hypothetical protein